MLVLPLFPLQLVVFPNEKVNLHIFEPRYKKLIRHCEENSTNFGITPHLNGELHNVGTELELLSIYNLQIDGSCDVELMGKRVFNVIDFIYPEKLDDYLEGSVDFLPLLHKRELRLQIILLDKLKELFEYLEIKKKLPEDANDLYSFDFGHYVGFNPMQELQFIQILDESERIEYLLKQLDVFIPQVLEVNNLKKRAQLNGHIKYLKPPTF